MIDAQTIDRSLKRHVPIYTYDLITSTNDAAKDELLKNPLPEALFVARGQSAGQGRHGRSFYSPCDSGIYMTYAFKLDEISCHTPRLTTAASVAVAQALNCDLKIKWVNDLYLRGKKVCGILCKSEKIASQRYIMVGVGINLTTRDFPFDIKDKAGSLGRDLDKNKTIALLCNNLFQLADDPLSSEHLKYYREHVLGMGQTICYKEGEDTHRAKMLGVGDLGELLVLEGKRLKRLYSCETTLLPLGYGGA